MSDELIEQHNPPPTILDTTQNPVEPQTQTYPPGSAIPVDPSTGQPIPPGESNQYEVLPPSTTGPIEAEPMASPQEELPLPKPKEPKAEGKKKRK